jgi:hypothetical protein
LSVPGRYIRLIKSSVRVSEANGDERCRFGCRNLVGGMNSAGSSMAGAGGAGRLQALLVGPEGRRNAVRSMDAGRAESPARGGHGKTLTMGVSGEHGDSPDVAMKRPDVSLAQ